MQIILKKEDLAMAIKIIERVVSIDSEEKQSIPSIPWQINGNELFNDKSTQVHSNNTININLLAIHINLPFRIGKIKNKKTGNDKDENIWKLINKIKLFWYSLHQLFFVLKQ